MSAAIAPKRVPRLFTRTEPLKLPDGTLIAQKRFKDIAPWDDVDVKVRGGGLGYGPAVAVPGVCEDREGRLRRAGCAVPDGWGRARVVRSAVGSRRGALMSGPTRVPDEADKPTTTNTACTHQTPHDHGTRLCYQADACRCTACSAAWVRYQRRRRGLDPEPDGRRKPSHTPLGTSLAYAHPVHVDDDPFPWFAHCGCGWRSYRKASKRDAGREAAAHLINVGLSWAAGARPQLVDTDTGGVYLVAEHPCGHMCRTCAIRSRRLAGVS